MLSNYESFLYNIQICLTEPLFSRADANEKAFSRGLAACKYMPNDARSCATQLYYEF